MNRLQFRGRVMPILVPALVLLALAFDVVALGASSGNTASAEAIPVIDGEIGHCSVEFTVTNADGKPAAGAKIRVHIAYGFMSLRKLDLEVGTNSDGKARFEGLPERTKRALYFRASQGDLEGSAAYDPAESCTAVHTIVLQPAKP